MHSRQYILNVEGPPKFCIDLEADWLLILGEVGGKSPGMFIMSETGLQRRIVKLYSFHIKYDGCGSKFAKLKL